MEDSALTRIIAFKNEFARRQAQHVIDVAGGFAVLHAEFAASYDHNKLILSTLADPADAQATADRVLGGANLAHRLVVVNDNQTALAGARLFTDAGYQHETSIFMQYTGAAADRPADPAILVTPVPWEALQQVDRRTWRTQLPAASEQTIEQLVRRRAARLLGADEVTFLAIRDDAGCIISHAELYIDAQQGIAQIEQVMTLPGHGGRGYARAIMAEGLRRAIAARTDVLFVEADAEDWPRHLYNRLGYVTIGRTHAFTRSAPSH